MSTPRRRLPAPLAKGVDALVYAVVVVAIFFVVLTPLSFAAGGEWVGVKILLFLLGFAVMGVSLWLLKPVRPDKREERGTQRPYEGGESRFEAFLHSVPPLSWFDIPPSDRFDTGARWFITSLLMLATSYAMETVFGVAAV